MTAPSGRAKITAERYVSAEVAELEWKKLWPRMWLFAGLKQDVREPGEFFVFSLGRESILVTVTDEGELVAFYNVCQHRGARVMLAERGWVQRFVCPYHGWEYEHDGRLTVVPDAERFSQGSPCDLRGLVPVRAEEWAGMIWVCMDDDAPPFDEFIGPLKEKIDPYRLEDMVLVEDQTCRLDCNWKAVFDNFGELYHVEHIHPQHAKIFDCPTGQVDLYPGGHNVVFIKGFTVNSRLPIPEEPPGRIRQQLEAMGLDPADYNGRVLDIRADVQKRRREVGPELGYDYDRLSDDELTDIVQYNVFPNVILTMQPEDLLIMRPRPHPTDPNKCFWDKMTLRMPPNEGAARKANVSFSPRMAVDVATAERPERDEFDQDDIIEGRKTMTITIDQDIHLIRDIQAGMHSRGFSDAWLSDEENRVQHFHDWLDYYLA